MDSGRYRPKTILTLVVSLAVVAVLVVLGAAYYPWWLGPRQPIPFSHRIHAGTREISCLFCHSGALSGSVATMPPVETCMLCHKRIIPHYPEIERVRRHYQQAQPIAWVRVSNLPDHAHFDHSIHLVAGVDCGTCHGDVKAMDRIVLRRKLDMGFCIQCHRDYDATRDCFTCHY